jgi:hypothetical protein
VYDRATQTVLYEPSRFLDGISPQMYEKIYIDPGAEL